MNKKDVLIIIMFALIVAASCVPVIDIVSIHHYSLGSIRFVTLFQYVELLFRVKWGY